MPMLKKSGVPSLLSKFEDKSLQQSRCKTRGRSHSLPDVDPYAEPLSTSDAESVDIELPPDARTSTDSSPGCNSRSIGSPTQRQTLVRRKTAATAFPNGVGSSKKGATKPSYGGPPTGQKRKLQAHSATYSVAKAEGELEATFDVIYSQGEKRKKKRQYRGGHASSATVNLHASPERNNHTVILSKHAKGGFKKPDDIDAWGAESDKNIFSMPMPLQGYSNIPNLKSSAGTRSRMASLTSSHPLQALGSSEPSTERSSVLSSPPVSETVKPTQEHFEQQLATLEALDSPPGLPRTPSAKSTVAMCPMCKTEVDLDYLLSFSKGNKLRLKEAIDFCREHKQRSVENDGKLSKYPQVSWSNLGKRLRKFNNKLDAILDRRATSLYWDELEKTIASGKSRNALRNPEAENVQRLKGYMGYYGSKGARKMMEHIMARFANKIRALAAKESLFTEVGVSGFVQAVLVPELVLMLVMEDYEGCNALRARQIVAESADTGDLMNEEEEERIEEKLSQDDAKVGRVRRGTG